MDVARSTVDALTAAVHAGGRRSDATGAEHKKRWGQYFTGRPVAEFMAELLIVGVSERDVVRVLDPGAGVGILGIAAVRRILATTPRSVHLVAIELEPNARRELCSALSTAVEESGQRLTFDVVADDFLVAAQPRLGQPALGDFDFVIANPPYFKLSPDDPRGGGTRPTFMLASWKLRVAS